MTLLLDIELFLLKLVDKSALLGFKLLKQYSLKSAWKEASLDGDKIAVTQMSHKVCNRRHTNGAFYGKNRVPVLRCHRGTVTPVHQTILRHI